MENSREDIKNKLLKKIDGFIDKDSYGVAELWVNIFSNFLTALAIEANIPKKEK